MHNGVNDHQFPWRETQHSSPPSQLRLSCKPVKYDELTRCAKNYGVTLPDLTTHRQVVGTMASTLQPHQQEKVAAFLKHSLATQQRYYRHLEASRDSVEAFQLVQKTLQAPQQDTPSTSCQDTPSTSRQDTHSTNKRFHYSAEDEHLIKEWFVDYINGNTLPTMAICGSSLGSIPWQTEQPST